jgi:hypothetical protein
MKGTINHVGDGGFGAAKGAALLWGEQIAMRCIIGGDGGGAGVDIVGLQGSKGITVGVTKLVARSDGNYYINGKESWKASHTKVLATVGAIGWSTI